MIIALTLFPHPTERPTQLQLLDPYIEIKLFNVQQIKSLAARLLTFWELLLTHNLFIKSARVLTLFSHHSWYAPEKGDTYHFATLHCSNKGR